MNSAVDKPKIELLGTRQMARELLNLDSECGVSSRILSLNWVVWAWCGAVLNNAALRANS